MSATSIPTSVPPSGGSTIAQICLDGQELRAMVQLLNSVAAELANHDTNGRAVLAAPKSNGPTPAPQRPTLTSEPIISSSDTPVQPPRPHVAKPFAPQPAPDAGAAERARLAEERLQLARLQQQQAEEQQRHQAAAQAEQRRQEAAAQEDYRRRQAQLEEQRQRAAAQQAAATAAAAQQAAAAAAAQQAAAAAAAAQQEAYRRQQQQPQPPPRQQQRAVPAAAAGWRMCYSTDASDHNREAVHAMCYCPTFEGLPGGDGHAGWLISSSRNVLNLWECSAGGGNRGQPSLQLMHSQETDLLSSRLVVDSQLQLMFASSLDTRSRAECISVHSLSPEAGVLAYKYRFAPHRPQGVPPNARLMQHVVSLHGTTGSLRGCAASSFGGSVLVWESFPLAQPQPQGTVPRPKADFLAHSCPISAMHRSAFAPVLFTGGSEGAVHMWHLGTKPSSPQLRFVSHTQPVSSVQQTSETQLITSGRDGKVCFWDVRQASHPRHAMSLDGSPVLLLAASPGADFLAASTQKGLYSLDMQRSAGGAVPVPMPLPANQHPIQDISWNVKTGELYACGASGSVTVYGSGGSWG